MKDLCRWYSPRLNCDVSMVRYGHYGVPLLLFPTAGGDCEEAERHQLVDRLAPFIQDGRLKVFSVDSVAGRTWLTDDRVAHGVWMQQQFDQYIRYEVVPAIHSDCRSNTVPIFVAGASIGAYNALLAICRHPDVFVRALCMSGTYDLDHWLNGQWLDEYHHVAPLHFVPLLPEGGHLQLLRQRFIILATGQGNYENPGESWKVVHALGTRGIPNRLDLWDTSWPHEWGTWRAMVPQYLQEMLVSLG